MYNMNSPTLQAMLQNVPQGMGNMPSYNGSAPTITTQTQQFTTPYPSPKEMLIQSGQQNIYQPVGFGVPQPMMPGYNPTPQPMMPGYYNHTTQPMMPGYNPPPSPLAGYSNPYMGYGTYGGYSNYTPVQYMNPQAQVIYNAAISNGRTYEEQVKTEINVCQRVSRIVSKLLGRDEEETNRRAEFYDPRTRFKSVKQEDGTTGPITLPNETENMIVSVYCGDKKVYESNPQRVRARCNNLIESPSVAMRILSNAEYRINYIRYYRRRMYELAPERVADGMTLAEFFTGGLAMIAAGHLEEELKMQRLTNVGRVYDSAKFRNRVLMNNGITPNAAAIARYTGRYGYMPNGRPVTPGLDPSIAQSFSYDEKTKTYLVSPPNFIRNKLEEARDRFVQTLNIS